jgi:hypothetical protein
MKPIRKLHERLLDLHDKYDDVEIARCALVAAEMQKELSATRWDRAREWTLLAVIVLWALRVALPEVAKWL